MPGEVDRNCISYWWPRLASAGLPAPDTRLVHGLADGVRLLDGQVPDRWDETCEEIDHAAHMVGGYPVFLRTGHGSGKHEWQDTCYLAGPEMIEQHVANLIEWSHMVDIMGLPHDVWAVRRLLPTAPLFHAFAGRMPITREFRLFVPGGPPSHTQPYWPPDAISHPDVPDDVWRQRLFEASRLAPAEHAVLAQLARRAVHAVGGGYWTVDLLQDRHGKWWVTDMADGARSFRWEPDA